MERSLSLATCLTALKRCLGSELLSAACAFKAALACLIFAGDTILLYTHVYSLLAKALRFFPGIADFYPKPDVQKLCITYPKPVESCR